jgi:hypothetical protein
VEDLSGDDYALLGNIRVGDVMLTLPEFDRRSCTLFIGLFVGHPDNEFDVDTGELEYAIETVIFREFQLVAIFSLHPMASHYSSEYGFSITYDPHEADQSIEIQSVLSSLMTGKSPEECLVLYRSAVDALSLRFLKRILQEATEPTHILRIKKMIENVGCNTSVEMAFGDDEQDCQIIFSKPFPNRS